MQRFRIHTIDIKNTSSYFGLTSIAGSIISFNNNQKKATKNRYDPVIKQIYQKLFYIKMWKINRIFKKIQMSRTFIGTGNHDLVYKALHRNDSH